jgi:hypothetical protein
VRIPPWDIGPFQSIVDRTLVYTEALADGYQRQAVLVELGGLADLFWCHGLVTNRYALLSQQSQDCSLADVIPAG